MASQENTEPTPNKDVAWRPLDGKSFDSFDLLRFGTFLRLYRERCTPVRPGDVNAALLIRDPKFPARATETFTRLKEEGLVDVVDTAPVTEGSTIMVERYVPCFDSMDKSSLAPLVTGTEGQVAGLRGLVSVEARLLTMETSARSLETDLRSLLAEKNRLHEHLIALNTSEGEQREESPRKKYELDPAVRDLSVRMQATREGVAKIRERLLGTTGGEVVPQDVLRLEEEYEAHRVALKYAVLDVNATQREIDYFRKLIEQSEKKDR